MKIASLLCATVICLALAACGGGNSGAEPSSPARARAAAPMSAEIVDASALFSWAESAYPQFFPPAGTDGTHDVYQYRYYAATGNYIGIADGRVFVLGPLSGGSILFVGRWLDFACQLQPAACDTSAPLSQVQAKLEAAMMPSYSLAYFSGEALATDKSKLAFFLVDRLVPYSPRSRSDGVGTYLLANPVSAVASASVPTSYGVCSTTVSGTSTTSAFLGTTFADTGALSKTCSNGAFKMQYVGDEAYLHSLDAAGQTYNIRRVTDVVTTDLQGQNILANLVTAFNSTEVRAMAANSAVFPVGAKMHAVWGYRPYSYVNTRSADGKYTDVQSLIPVQQSGLAVGGTPAASLEQAFPWTSTAITGTTLAQSAGSITTLNGRRVWVRNPTGAVPTGFGSTALVEVDGRVYAGTYYPPYTTPTVLFYFYNATARNAILSAGLTW